MNFNELIETNRQNVKNIIKKITSSENEDLEQEVFVKAWKNSNKYEEQGNFGGWIVTIAKNVAIDYLKSAFFRNSENTTSDDYALECVKDKRLNPEKTALVSERQRLIINAVEELKPKLKEVIMLCEIYGYTYEEASSKLHCPIGTIKSRIYNAKKELAEKLSELIED